MKQSSTTATRQYPFGRPMLWTLRDLLAGDRVRYKAIGICLLILTFNAIAWGWAFAAFRGSAVLFGTALLAYGLGLRHAVDADHIAAIDNVTRKLAREGRRPVCVGTYFSLGHSTIVFLASLGVAVAATAFQSQLVTFRSIGGFVGTLVSAVFLLAIAAMNFVILAAIVRTFLQVKAGGSYVEEDLDMLLAGRGILARIFRPMFALIHCSWQMYPLGLLFGLGFDTASEVALLGISAAQSSSGLALWSIMVFPVLFAAGMSLVDTVDGVLMLGAYGWASLKPMRKLGYNISITGMSATVALLIGGVEALGLIGDKLTLKGTFWSGVTALNGNLASVGYLIVAVLIGSWIVSAAFHRLRSYSRVEIDQ